jgi:acetyl esterase
MAGNDPLAPFADKYAIHEETRLLVRLLAAAGVKPLSELGVEKARQAIIDRNAAMKDDTEFDGEETEIIVPSPFSSEGIPVSIYKPAKRPEVPAIWIYFHGGGLVICNRKTHESTLKILARDSGAIILNVEYRLLPNPEAPCAPFDDAEVVTKWVLKNREKVGGKPNSKVGVGGDSAGGQLAIGVTNDIQGLDFQILIYPLSDTSLSSDSVRDFKDAPVLNEDGLKFCFENAIGLIPDYLTSPRINGMARTNTASSPPALIILAEIDPLVGSGIDYTEKLRAAGVEAELVIIKGVTHGFYTYGNIFKTTAALAYSHTVTFLKRFQ